MLRVTEDQIAKIAQTSVGPIVKGFTKALDDWGDYFGLTTEPRLEHFIGQCAEECGFITMREYGADSYFKRYEFRKDLGNTVAGDGLRFKGRGAIQLTGRNWYTKFTRWVRDVFAKVYKLAAPDFIANPEKLEDPFWGTVSSLWYWQTAGIAKYADAGDTRGETRRINGGYTNYEKRVYFIGRAQAIITGAAIPPEHDRETPPLPNAVDPPKAPSSTGNTVAVGAAGAGGAAVLAHSSGVPWWLVIAGVVVVVAIIAFVTLRKQSATNAPDHPGI